MQDSQLFVGLNWIKFSRIRKWSLMVNSQKAQLVAMPTREKIQRELRDSSSTVTWNMEETCDQSDSEASVFNFSGDTCSVNSTLDSASGAGSTIKRTFDFDQDSHSPRAFPTTSTPRSDDHEVTLFGFDESDGSLSKIDESRNHREETLLTAKRRKQLRFAEAAHHEPKGHAVPTLFGFDDESGGSSFVQDTSCSEAIAEIEWSGQASLPPNENEDTSADLSDSGAGERKLDSQDNREGKYYFSSDSYDMLWTQVIFMECKRQRWQTHSAFSQRHSWCPRTEYFFHCTFNSLPQGQLFVPRHYRSMQIEQKYSGTFVVSFSSPACAGKKKKPWRAGLPFMCKLAPFTFISRNGVAPVGPVRLYFCRPSCIAHITGLSMNALHVLR